MVCLAVNLAAERQKDRPAPKAAAPKAPATPQQKGERTAVDRFNRMPPDKRQQALAKLPPERRKKIEDQLNQYKSLTPEQRRDLRSRYQAFNQFPPEKQNQARRLFRQFGELPEQRQAVVRKEFENLRAMPEADRRARMNSDEFRSKYNSHEQKFLSDFSALLKPSN
jgi:hypothetical protein